MITGASQLEVLTRTLVRGKNSFLLDLQNRIKQLLVSLDESLTLFNRVNAEFVEVFIPLMSPL